MASSQETAKIRRGSENKVLSSSGKPILIIVEGVNRIIITGDMIAADIIAMDLVKQYDDSFNQANEAIVRRHFEHAEDLGLGTSDLSELEIIELKV